MITALQKSESDPNFINDLMKSSEKLGKVLREANIRVLMDSMLKKNGADMYVLTASLSSFFIQFLFPLLKFSPIVAESRRMQSEKRKFLSNNWRKINEKLKRRKREWTVNNKRKNCKV